MGNDVTKEQLSLISNFYYFHTNFFICVCKYLADVDDMKKHINLAWMKY